MRSCFACGDSVISLSFVEKTILFLSGRLCTFVKSQLLKREGVFLVSLAVTTQLASLRLQVGAGAGTPRLSSGRDGVDTQRRARGAATEDVAVGSCCCG